MWVELLNVQWASAVVDWKGKASRFEGMIRHGQAQVGVARPVTIDQCLYARDLCLTDLYNFCGNASAMRP